MRILLILWTVFLPVCIFAQVNPNDTIRVENHPKDSVSATVPKSEVEVLSNIQSANTPKSIQKFNPTKAGLYAAVLPGLGQYYNKKYWKIPLVWGAIGAGIGYTLWSDKQYKRYRNAFVAELNGQPHEFSDISGVTADVLGRTQDRVKRQRDYAIAITGLLYVLNIVDAVVDAHLYEGRHDPDLALQPAVIYDQYSQVGMKSGLQLSFKF